MPSTTPTTVGRFTFDPTDSSISGPADYIRSDQYARLIKRIESGTDVPFRMACEHSPDFETALLVTVQTDYAGWAGMEQFNRMREAAAR